MSDAIKGITAKFMHVFEGPFLISKILNHSAYELKDERGKIRGGGGEFNNRQLKQYIQEENVQKEGSDLWIPHIGTNSRNLSTTTRKEHHKEHPRHQQYLPIQQICWRHSNNK
jgi:hypothetical protein